MSAGEFLYEVSFAIFTLALGWMAGYDKLSTTPPNYLMGYGGPAVGIALFVASITRAFSRNAKAQSDDTPHALDAALQVLHSLLAAETQLNDGELRICVFVPQRNQANTVHQLTDYVGCTMPYGKDRDLSSRCGVVGRAFRKGEAEYDKLPKNTSLVDYLVNQNGFDRVEAVNMRQDRRAWAAIPVGEPGAVVAVIYLDTTRVDFFGKAGSQRRRILENALPGIARFIRSI